MRRVAFAFYMLPGSGRQPPHKSSGRLTATEAAAQGALYPIPGTTVYEYVPENDAERQALAGNPQPTASAA